MSDRDAPTDDPSDDATIDDAPEETTRSAQGAGPPSDPDRSGAATGGDATNGSDRDPHGTDDGLLSDGVALAVSLLFGFALAVGAILLVSWLDPGFEDLLRIRPTVAGGGVGAGWVAGNADFWLNLMIALVHLADVVMGVFILAMVFIHWAAFRRLAARMRPPGARPEERRTPATDGGERETVPEERGDTAGDTAGERGGDPG